MGPPKLPEAKSVRDLSKIVEDVSSFAVFRSTDGSVTHALARLESLHALDFGPTVVSCESALASLPPDVLRKMNAEDVGRLESLRSRIDQLLKDRAKLIGD